MAIKNPAAHKRRTVKAYSKPDFKAIQSVPKPAVPAVDAEAGSSHNATHVESLAQDGETADTWQNIASADRKPHLNDGQALQTLPLPLAAAVQSANVSLPGDSGPGTILPISQDEPEGNASPDINFDEILPFMKTLLKSHQREGVRGMIELETGPFQGGILADEMGVGKTIECLSLVALGKCRPNKKPTLIVVPGPQLLDQFEAEISRHTELSCLLYHGEDRSRLCKLFKLVDIVLTTYDMLRADLPEKARDIARDPDRRREFGPISNDKLKGWAREAGEPAPLFEQDWDRVIFDEGQ